MHNEKATTPITVGWIERCISTEQVAIINSSSKPRRQFHFYPLTHSCFCFPPALLASDLCIQSLNFLGLCIYPFIHIASLSTDSAPCIHLIDEISVDWGFGAWSFQFSIPEMAVDAGPVTPGQVRFRYHDFIYASI